MSPVRATALCGRIRVSPLQGSSNWIQPTQGFTQGYELKVSPSGLLTERLKTKFLSMHLLSAKLEKRPVRAGHGGPFYKQKSPIAEP